MLPIRRSLCFLLVVSIGPERGPDGTVSCAEDTEWLEAECLKGMFCDITNRGAQEVSAVRKTPFGACRLQTRSRRQPCARAYNY